ncbi:MAG: DUF3450 domain-containing protein [Nevskiales bacterium]|nr:DUF3450 domain-containing protein [Nevskiales bacterium]
MRPGQLVAVALMAMMPMAASAQSATVTRAIDETMRTQQSAAQSQDRIDHLDDQTRALLERYRAALWQSQQLSVYADQIDELSQSQEAERESLKRQIAEMERVERELLPLMLRMIDSLDSFVEFDLPFLQDERRERVAALRALMADASSSTAERFRRIVEAYQIEVDYGRGFGAERVEIEGRVMDQLRIGRAALFALALDDDEALRWDAGSGSWEEVDGRYLAAIREGLRIARETAAPNLLILPMPTAAKEQP